MAKKSLNLSIILLFVCAIVVKHAESKFVKSVKGEFEKLGDGWYDPSDQVIMLDYTNFTSTIASGTTAWFVEFYKSWCGDCIRFTPTWVAFVKSVLEWSEVVKIAAIACSNDINFPTCQSYGIKTVPTVKYFSIGDKGLGSNVTKGTEEGTDDGAVESLRERLIQKLQEDQQNGKGGANWPDFSPYRRNDTEHWKTALPSSVIYQFFLFESTDSYVGSEVMLNLHKLKNLQIRRVTEDNTVLRETYNITKLPALLVFDRNSTHVRLELSESTHESITKVIKNFMRSHGHLAESDKSNQTENQTTPPAPVAQPVSSKKQYKDVVYRADLAAALGYTLEQEIPLTEVIEGEQLVAVKNYLQALVKYFPLKKGNIEFLTALEASVSKRSNITGREFGNLVSQYEQKLSPSFLIYRDWVGCQGSQPRRRGIPCGVWTLFHTLTVQQTEEYDNGGSQGQSEGGVLRVMHGYIKNFFSCEACSRHFVQMASDKKLFDVKTADDEIMWLWSAHNIVNARLAGDPTEDPAFPKIQYPSEKNCNTCKNSDGSWNQNQVLNYLKHKYSRSNIVFSAERIEETEHEASVIETFIRWFNLSLKVLTFDN